jgi:hypothetical protein
MQTLLVTYDLNKSGQDYTDFHKVIKSYGTWARLSESSYAILTAESPTEVYNRLSPYMDKNDTTYVIGLHRPWMGYGPTAVNDWLEKNLTTVPENNGYRIRF